MEPRSLWASSHGEKASIPTTKIELARFGIGTLLSAEHDLYDREWPFSVPAWNASLRGASIKSSSKDAGTTRELDMESIREHSDGLEQNRQGADGLAPHNRQGHARCCFEAVSPEVPRARRAQEVSMRHRLLALLIAVACAVAIVIAIPKLAAVFGRGLDPADTAKTTTTTDGVALKTAWGDPDLEGIWTYDHQIPLQRPEKYAGKEFFTDAEIAELDRLRAGQQRQDYRPQRGTEADVSGAYNTVFLTIRPTGRRTSLIVDPPNGRVPPLTPEAQKRINADREFRLALLQATETCKNREAGCAGGKYGPPSPRRAEVPPAYLTAAVNRSDGPEDRSLGERCMGGLLPDFGTEFGGSYRRIVQALGSVAILYDVGQGQGFSRTIPITTEPHVPSNIRQRFGDSRGHWEGNTL